MKGPDRPQRAQPKEDQHVQLKYNADGSIATQGECAQKFPFSSTRMAAKRRSMPTVATIGRLNGEAKAHRVAKEEAETNCRHLLASKTALLRWSP